MVHPLVSRGLSADHEGHGAPREFIYLESSNAVARPPPRFLDGLSEAERRAVAAEARA